MSINALQRILGLQACFNVEINRPGSVNTDDYEVPGLGRFVFSFR